MTLTAVVIRRGPMREHDQMVVLYGQESGRLRGIARGSLRAVSRQAPALDEGNLVTCSLVQGRGDLPLVTGAQAQRCWARAKAQPVAWAVAQFFFQVMDAAVFDAQPDPPLWGALTGVLEGLDAGAEPLVVLRRGQAQFLESLGYGRRDPAPAIAQACDADAAFERIAQRHLTALDLVYHLAG